MQEISSSPESIESKREMVGEWVGKFSSEQKVGEISSDVVREVLESYGAEFEGLSEEAKKSLGGYSEKEKGLGVRVVWGDAFVDDYKDWTNKFIDEYESNPNNKRLPELKPSGRKNSGMIQFLFDLTSFASGEYSFETFKTYTEGRVKNGQAWAENRNEDRIRVKVPNSTEPILLSSVPPEFPVKAWEWMTKNGLK